METNNKLRKALTKILNLTNSLDEDCAVDPVEIRDIARVALADPVRNYEVGTAEQQFKRLRRMCKKVECRDCVLRSSSYRECTLRWAQAPYEKGGDK